MGYEDARKASEEWMIWDKAERKNASGFEEGDTMFSVRARPWHGIGTVLDAPPNGIEDALEKSGLNWDVEKRPVIYEGHDSEDLRLSDNHYVIVRTDNMEPMGCVSGRYRIVQNREAFSFVDELIGSSMHFETAGSLWSGRKVFVVATLPDDILVGGDKIEEFVTIANSHDGTGAVKVYVTPVRTVCQNSLSVSIGAASATFSIRHVGDVRYKLAAARNTLQITSDYYANFKEFGDKLALEPISEKKILEVLEKTLYPNGVGDTDRSKQSWQDTQAQFMFTLQGPTQGNAPGTKWSAWNGICEYLDYYRPTKGSTERFGRIMFEAQNPKQKALDLVIAA